MFVTLGFKEIVRVPPGMEATFKALRSWLNSWRGIGDIETGMRRQGYDPWYDLHRCRYDGRGRAGDVLHDRDGAPPDRHHRLGLGADPLGGGATRSSPNTRPDRPDITMIAWLANNTWTAAASC